MKRAKSGFTLIELLVVIAIIAILAAILFPVLANAKERGRQMQCLGNMRQLSNAVRLYTGDYSGRLPNPRIKYLQPDWCGCVDTDAFCYPKNGQIWDYVKTAKLYLCPSDLNVPAKEITKLNRALKEDQKNYPLSYSMNYKFLYLGTNKREPILLDTIRRQKEVLMLVHEGRKGINDGNFNWENDLPSDVHWDGTTVVYTDGHADWRSYKELWVERKSKKWDPAL